MTNAYDPQNPYAYIGDLGNIQERKFFLPEGTPVVAEVVEAKLGKTNGGSPFMELTTRGVQGIAADYTFRNTFWLNKTPSQESLAKAQAAGKAPKSAFEISLESIKAAVKAIVPSADPENDPTVRTFFAGVSSDDDIAARLNTLAGRTFKAVIGLESGTTKSGKPFNNNFIRQWVPSAA